MSAAVGALLAIAAAAAGVWALRSAWARRAGGWRAPLGWAALAAGTCGWRLAGAALDKAVALAVVAGGLAGLAAVVAGADPPRRGADPRRDPREAEPPATGGPGWSAWLRAAGVGPLALAAALGCATWLVVRGPGAEADRLVAAGFLMPSLWAGAAVWAVTDARPGRVALALAATAAAAWAAARP